MTVQKCLLHEQPCCIYRDSDWGCAYNPNKEMPIDKAKYFGHVFDCIFDKEPADRSVIGEFVASLTDSERINLLKILVNNFTSKGE
jgi:hypothetical protein